MLSCEMTRSCRKDSRQTEQDFSTLSECQQRHTAQKILSSEKIVVTVFEETKKWPGRMTASRHAALAGSINVEILINALEVELAAIEERSLGLGSGGNCGIPSFHSGAILSHLITWFATLRSPASCLEELCPVQGESCIDGHRWWTP